MKFTEAQLEQAFINLLQEEEMTHVVGGEVRKIEFNGVSEPPTAYGYVVSEKVLLTDELRHYLRLHYASEHITENEIASIVRDLERLPSSDLYETNKTIMKMVSDGFLLKREDRSQKDIYIQLIDYSESDKNTYTIVNQLAIKGYEMRIPDLILYINGLPLVVFEFKTAIEENTTIHDAYKQLTTRYKRDIPDLSLRRMSSFMPGAKLKGW
jgi:type I restriction enzyme R subunit